MTSTLVTQDRPAKVVSALAARARAGVTLTEILFAIMVMGVGLLSVLSLFPIGLLNVARAVQLSRAGAYADGVFDDLQTRDLMDERRYRFGPVNGPLSPNPAVPPPLYREPRLNSPFIGDHGLLRNFIDDDGDGVIDNFRDLADPITGAAIAQPGERGLPVAIDPLYVRRVVFPTVALLGPMLPPVPVPLNNRLGLLRDGGGQVVNWGMQRSMPTDGISTDGERFTDASDVNFDLLINSSDLNGDEVPDDAYPDWLNASTLLFPGLVNRELYLPQSLAEQIFASRDDIAYRETDPNALGSQENQWQPLYGPQLNGVFAPALPFGNYGEPVREQKYSSLVTAYLPDAGDTTRYEVSTAVFFKRDFLPTGERTVRAYYLPQPGTGPNSALNVALPLQPSNQMILMWPTNTSEPEVPREGWLLDATNDALAGPWNVGPPGRQSWPHRAFWYRIVDRGEPQTGYLDNSNTFVPFLIDGQPAVRQLITLDRPVREITWAQNALNTNSVWYPLDPSVDANFSPIQAAPVDMNAGVANGQFTVNVAVLFPGLVSVYERTLTVSNP